jgi:hypothetical protein
MRAVYFVTRAQYMTSASSRIGSGSGIVFGINIVDDGQSIEVDLLTELDMRHNGSG